jgi:hypothetical protein
MQERGWGALSTEDWGKRTLPGTVNKQAGRAREPLAGAGAGLAPSNQELVKVAVGGKLHRRRGKIHLPHEL